MVPPARGRKIVERFEMFADKVVPLICRLLPNVIFAAEVEALPLPNNCCVPPKFASFVIVTALVAMVGVPAVPVKSPANFIVPKTAAVAWGVALAIWASTYDLLAALVPTVGASAIDITLPVGTIIFPAIVPPDNGKNVPDNADVLTLSTVPEICKLLPRVILAAALVTELLPINDIVDVKFANFPNVIALGATVGVVAVPVKSPANCIFP
jgi:hypothetical protein